MEYGYIYNTQNKHINTMSSTVNNNENIKKQIIETINKLKTDRDATFAQIGPIEVLFMRIKKTRINCCPKNPSDYWKMNNHDEYEKIFESMGIMFSGATKGNMLIHAFNAV